MKKSMLYTRAHEAGAFVRAQVSLPVEVGVVLGSGLGGLADRFNAFVSVPYSEIPHFPVTTVAGHAGRLSIGKVGSIGVALLQGRFHFYEGYDFDAITFPIRVLQAIGTKRLILTAATGGIREGLQPGMIVLLNDHINMLGVTPLRGGNDDRLGPRFPDLTEVYSASFRATASAVANRRGIPIETGVYACMPGPCYETPAEIWMLRTLGADVVGMSTVPEAIVARHAGIELLGIALVTNHAAGVTSTPLSHHDVLEASEAASDQIGNLIQGTIEELARGGSIQESE